MQTSIISFAHGFSISRDVIRESYALAKQTRSLSVFDEPALKSIVSLSTPDSPSHTLSEVTPHCASISLRRERKPS